MGKPSIARLVSEPTRQRETFKYDPSLLTSVKYNNDGVPIPSCDLATSPDTVLTALSQLGACRLNTARSLISLFDKDWQYIVAEATPTLPLVPNLRHEDREEALWLCGTAIPRRHGVCEYTLCASNPDQFIGADDPSTLPVALVSDLTSDPRFSYKPYCLPGAPARFYAAVPIRTHRGINIGVYCVIDTEPRDVSGWDNRSSEILRDISSSIMHHLELRRSSYINTRSDIMNRGLGSFVEGKDALPPRRYGITVSESAPNNFGRNHFSLLTNQTPKPGDELAIHLSYDGEHSSQARVSSPSVPSTEMSPFQVVSRSEVDISTAQRTQNTKLLKSEPKPLRGVQSNGSKSPRQDSVHGIFSRAANIIREAIHVDGFLFLDASLGAFRLSSSSQVDSDESATSFSESHSASSGDERKSGATVGQRELSCRVLGFSESGQQESSTRSVLPVSVPQRVLSRLLRRYPRGKIFNFADNGELQSSDSSGDEAVSPNTRSRAQAIEDWEEGGLAKPESAVSRRHEGSTILETFTGARSVAFVPVWDAKRERWFAGGFAYTYSTTRIFTIEGELSYLRAFGMLTMEEYFQLETQQADKAKSDLLNSLSHELRSPLHGIVLGIELFNDTELDVFQRNIMHTLETCSRTLLDTVDHLLDFSKINNYISRKKARRQSAGARGLRPGMRPSVEAGLTNLNSHVRLDILVEEVMESVFAGFNFQHLSLSQLAQQGPGGHADVNANRRLDSMRAMEELGPGLNEAGELRLDFGRVSVFLNIDPASSWTFYTQPGAFRRIVMNLFGNAMKYTRAGTITVSMKQDCSTKPRRDGTHTVKLTVSDTGKGISEDYLRHELFRPFSQEDHLAPGTGLGLSLVKQITSQMKGKISVKSQVGLGTTVSVSLPLRQVLHSAETDKVASQLDDSDFALAFSDLQGRVLCLVDPGRPKAVENSQIAVPIQSHALFEKLCRGWFTMDVISQSQACHGSRGDVALCFEEDMSKLPYVSGGAAFAMPTVVICQNALVSFRRSSSIEFSKMPGVFELISHPIGPRKLARALSSAMRRWRNVSTNPPEREKVTTPPLPIKSPLYTEWALPIVGNPYPSEGLEQQAPMQSTEVSNSMTVAPTTAATASGHVDPVGNASAAFLLVDDNQINLKILSAYTKKLGRAYTTATNGLEAVDVYCENPGRYRCVFMDISMPVMDGFEATRRIRRHERHAGLPPAAIFALSGLASASAQQEAFESGIDLFLTKPVKLKELSNILSTRGLL